MSRLIGISLFATSLFLSAILTPEDVTRQIIGFVHQNETLITNNGEIFHQEEEEGEMHILPIQEIYDRVSEENSKINDPRLQETEAQLNALLLQYQLLQQDNTKLKNILSKNTGESFKSIHVQEKNTAPVTCITYSIRTVSLVVMMVFFALLFRKLFLKNWNLRFNETKFPKTSSSMEILEEPPLNFEKTSHNEQVLSPPPSHNEEEEECQNAGMEETLNNQECIGEVQTVEASTINHPNFEGTQSSLTPEPVDSEEKSKEELTEDASVLMTFDFNDISKSQSFDEELTANEGSKVPNTLEQSFLEVKN